MVSALILCYNHAQFVTTCLDAVRAQTHSNLELIIVDDCSKDTSAQAITDWLRHYNKPATFIRHERNTGICRSLNDALRAAKGEYISLIAADDFWSPTKIANQVALLENAPKNIGVVYSDVHRVDEKGTPLPQSTYIAPHVPAWPPPSGDILTELWEVGNWIPPMGTLVRRECFD